MRDFTRLIENVPDYQEFLTVDEMDANTLALAKAHPDVVEVFEAGRSRKGHPIYCMKIGNGSKNAFLFGCPHPNEPMGCMMLEYLTQVLAEDDAFRTDMDYTWYIIKSIDVDGTKLNEKWFKGPFTLTNYARNYFRPAGYEQAEWTFPFSYKNYTFDKPIPETQALMKIIDEVKPTFMYSLHNSGFGGTYWYLTKEMPEIWDKLHEASKKQNIPLHLGEPEVNYITPYAPAIFPMIDMEQEYDYYEKFGDGVDPATMLGCGTSSSGYSKKYDTVTLVTELPYFFEERIQSDRKMSFTRREAALKKADFYYEDYAKVGGFYEKVEKLISEDNPFAKMVALSLKHNESSYETEKAFIETSPDYDGICKESEAFDNLELPKFFSLFSWTLMIRSCEHELEKDHSEEEKGLLREVHAACEAQFNTRAAEVERDIHYEVTPIKKLVSIQLESGMLVADQLNPRK